MCGTTKNEAEVSSSGGDQVNDFTCNINNKNSLEEAVKIYLLLN